MTNCLIIDDCGVEICDQCGVDDKTIHKFAIRCSNGCANDHELHGRFCSEECALAANSAEITAFSQRLFAAHLEIRSLSALARSFNAARREAAKREYSSPAAREARRIERERLRNETEERARAEAEQNRARIQEAQREKMRRINSGELIANPPAMEPLPALIVPRWNFATKPREAAANPGADEADTTATDWRGKR